MCVAQTTNKPIRVYTCIICKERARVIGTTSFSFILWKSCRKPNRYPTFHQGFAKRHARILPQQRLKRHERSMSHFPWSVVPMTRNLYTMAPKILPIFLGQYPGFDTLWIMDYDMVQLSSPLAITCGT